MDTLNTIVLIAVTGSLFYLAIDLIGYFFDFTDKKTSLKRILITGTIFIIVTGLYFTGYVNKKTITNGLGVGAVFSAFWIALVLLVKLISWLQMNSFSGKFKAISTITNNGFSIGNGKKNVQYRWDDFDSAEIHPSNLEVKLKGRKKLIINEKFFSFYTFLKKIPHYYKGFDYNIIDNFFDQLQPCKVCGLISATNEKCLYCNSTEWNTEIEKEYHTYQAYLKASQLEVFATWDKNEPFCDFKLTDHAFEADPSWKPLVTKKEVLEYSKKECWDEE